MSSSQIPHLWSVEPSRGLCSHDRFVASKARCKARQILLGSNLRICCHRREEDKFNVWLAYLNLENTYGEPPEEAALALFQRAAQV